MTNQTQTAFVKENFYKDSMYLNYRVGSELKFVARFKYNRGSRGSFQTFLIKNFTVEEYFGRLDAGEAPLDILKSRGYLQPHVKKWLKEGGYSVDQTGYDKYIQDQVAKIRNRG